MTDLIRTNQTPPALPSRTVYQTLPSLLPAASRLADAIQQAMDAGERVTGLGEHGSLSGVIEQVRLTDIWIDPRFIVRSSRTASQRVGAEQQAPGDDGDESSAEQFAAYAHSVDAHMVRDPQNQMIERYTPQPLHCLARTNPANRMQTLLLLWSYDDYLVAREAEWSHIECIVHADLPNYDVHNLVLHLAMRQAAPTKHDIFRQLIGLYYTWQEGDHADDSVPPPVNFEQLANFLGATRQYIGQLRAVYDNETARQLVAEGKVTVSTSILVLQKLGRYEDEADKALTHIADKGLSRADAQTYCQSVIDKMFRLRLKLTVQTPGEKAALTYQKQLLKTLTLLKEDPTGRLRDIYGTGYESALTQLSHLADVFAANITAQPEM